MHYQRDSVSAVREYSPARIQEWPRAIDMAHWEKRDERSISSEEEEEEEVYFFLFPRESASETSLFTFKENPSLHSDIHTS